MCRPGPVAVIGVGVGLGLLSDFSSVSSLPGAIHCRFWLPGNDVSFLLLEDALSWLARTWLPEPPGMLSTRAVRDFDTGWAGEAALPAATVLLIYASIRF